MGIGVLIVFKLFSTCKLDCILNSSSLLQYWSTTLQINVYNFYPAFDLESLRTKAAIFPES